MQVSLLLDENIAASLVTKLDKVGYDVERVVDVSELGEGVDDTAHSDKRSNFILESHIEILRIKW
jgi:hypothetical protein